jgi:hypothetical protein
MKTGFWIYSIILGFTLAFMPAKMNVNKTNELFINAINFSNDHFPSDNKKQLVYNSDFGESILQVNKESNLNIFTFTGDDFTYRQKLLINDEGVFVKETYQKMKLFLVFNKEGTFSYSEPLPRIKFPLEVGKTWEWKGTEYEDDDENTITVSAKVKKTEKLKVPAGIFETVKLVTIIKSSAGTKNVITEWYAKNIGLVKMSAVIEGGGIIGTARDLMGLGDIVFELKEIKTNM